MTSGSFDRDRALQISQAAIGNRPGSYTFQNIDGERVSLSDFAGKPLIISLIYTSCYHICPTTTRHLAEVIDAADEALGKEKFNVISIGFDAFRDNPPMMKQFAVKQGIDPGRWQFLSSDAQTIKALSEDLGFVFFPTANGFDHLIQTTILDGEGVVYRQVYGMDFEMPLLVEPLKNLVYSRTDSGLFEGLSDRINLFCTVYDPAQNKYKYDYSLFIGMFIGFVCVLVLGLQLFKEWRLSMRS